MCASGLRTSTHSRRRPSSSCLTMQPGRGYRPAEENKSPDQPIGVIPIDSIFSPVRRVAYAVEQARVGQRTDFDKLTLDIETDGRRAAGRAARGGRILISHLAIFTDAEPDRRSCAARSGPPRSVRAAGPGGRRSRAPARMDDILIEELELGVRSLDCLKRAGIQTVATWSRRARASWRRSELRQEVIDEVVETLNARGLGPARGLRSCATRSKRHKQPPRRTVRPCGTCARKSSTTSAQDQRGQGQGGQARGREADHARQAR